MFLLIIQAKIKILVSLQHHPSWPGPNKHLGSRPQLSQHPGAGRKDVMLHLLQDKEILPCHCVENLTELQYEKRLLNFPESEEMVEVEKWIHIQVDVCMHLPHALMVELVKKGFNLIFTQNKPHSRIHTILRTECLCLLPDSCVYPLRHHP